MSSSSRRILLDPIRQTYLLPQVVRVIHVLVSVRIVLIVGVVSVFGELIVLLVLGRVGGSHRRLARAQTLPRRMSLRRQKYGISAYSLYVQ